MDTPRFLEQIARPTDAPSRWPGRLMTDCLAALHEASYKRGPAAGVPRRTRNSAGWRPGT